MILKKNELKSSFIKVIEEDDRITNSKFCDCLKFKNYLKSIKKQLRKHRMAEYNSFNLKITNLISDAKSKCRADCGKDIKNKRQRKNTQKSLKKTGLKKSKKIFYKKKK